MPATQVVSGVEADQDNSLWGGADYCGLAPLRTRTASPLHFNKE